MRIELQIGLGLLPGAVAAIYFLIKRKAFRLNTIVSVLMILAASVSMTILGTRTVLETGERPHRELSREKAMTFANALFLQGAWDQAEDVLDNYSLLYGYDDECRLLTARIRTVQGDLQQARGLYTYLSTTELGGQTATEAQLVEQSIPMEGADRALVSYLISTGVDPAAYGLDSDDRIADRPPEPQNVAEEIRDAVSENYEISDDYRHWAAVVAGTGEQQLQPESEQEQAAWQEKLHQTFDQMAEKEPGLLNLSCVSRARIEAFALSGDYEAVTKDISQGSNHHELLSAAELYLRGAVGGGDFSDEYGSLDRRDVYRLHRQLQSILSDAKDNLEERAYRNLEDRVSSLSSRMEDYTLELLKTQMLDTVDVAAGDGSKIYLEASKIETYFDNLPMADEYLRLALATAYSSEDDTYRNAMAQIDGLITNQDIAASENIKGASEYVQQAVEHSTTVNLSSVPDTPGEMHESEDAQQQTEAETAGQQFNRAMVDYVSRAKSALSVGSINSEEFEKITAKVQISNPNGLSVEQIKSQLEIRDCGARIESFELEKIHYTSSDVTLCCDVSGSMSGNMEDLRNAVLSFIRNREEKERISLVTFNDNIVQALSVGATDEQLTQMAQEMCDGGGTNIFGAARDCLSQYSREAEKNNILIILTDGQDNSSYSYETMEQELGTLAAARGVTVYTLGLGDGVDTIYLTNLANVGSGEFIYVSDAASLESFYNMIHDQADDQYLLTYTARDTLMVRDRTLEVQLTSDGSRDVKKYSLNREAGEEDGTASVLQDKSIAGLSPRFLYKSGKAVTVSLKGSGFEESDIIQVKLQDSMEYDLETTFVDSETVSLTVPANVGVGTYDVVVTLNGRTRILSDGFSVVVPGKTQKTAFGPYVFTSTDKTVNADQSVTLRGHVQMNGWLTFKGDLTLIGDIENGGSIVVRDDSGSYVNFNPDTASGAAKILGQLDIPMIIPYLDEFRLYNDPIHLYDYDNYQVDDITPGDLEIFNLITVVSSTMRLYPDNFKFNLTTGTTMFPGQEKIMKLVHYGEKEYEYNLFSFQADGNAVVTPDHLGILLDIDYSDEDGKYPHKMNLFNAPVYINGNCKFHIDTVKNEYTVGTMVSMAFFAKETGVGAEVSWKGWTVDSAKLSLHLAKPVRLPTKIPIDANDFEFGAEDIEQVVDTGNWAGLKFTGKVSLETLPVSKYAPWLEKFVGDDMSLLSMPETAASLRFVPLGVELDASLYLLKDIKLANAAIKLGKFEMNSPLLELRQTEVCGLYAKAGLDIACDMMQERAAVNLTGQAELSAHSRFVGLECLGNLCYRFDWWMLNINEAYTGNFAIGVYITTGGDLRFVLATSSYSSTGTRSGKLYYIDSSGCGSGGTLN